MSDRFNRDGVSPSDADVPSYFERRAEAPLSPSSLSRLSPDSSESEDSATFGADETFVAERLAPENEEAPAPVPSVGLVNEGCTCYLNSLLQLLFHLRFFRNAVYRMPVEADESCSIHQALQELYFCMQERTSAVSTKKLTDAFGWDETQLFVQHDIQEMATLLRDNLEEKMKGTVTEGVINQLFEGYGEQVVVTHDCTYTSRRRDTFYDIHLPLGSYSTLMDSLRSLTTKEELVGDNKYRVEEVDKEPVYKEATKSYEFRRFPPVIWFHLKRFDIDLTSPHLEMKKINSRLEFPVELDLREIEKGSGDDEEMKRDEKDFLSSSTAACKKKNKDTRVHTETTIREEEDGKDEMEKKIEDCGDNARPLRTDSPAVYDLQGVIVHRGSVRSGHYYCYIREWDPATQTFTRWLEFDDERVNVVSEDVAVSNNFGGTTSRRVAHCRPVDVPAINNAYILSYVRRADCPTVFAPSSPDIVPQRLKDVLLREIREDKRHEEEKYKRQRRVTVSVLRDSVIRAHVAATQCATFPCSPRFSVSMDMAFEVLKSDPLYTLYDKIAEHPDIRHAGLSASALRLWRFSAGRACRPTQPLLARDEIDVGITIANCIDASDEQPTVQYLYLQQATKHIPLPLTDATPLVVMPCLERLSGLDGRLILYDSVALDAVTFLIDAGGYGCVSGRVRVSLTGPPNTSTCFTAGYESCFSINEMGVVRVPVNPERCPVHEVVYHVDTNYKYGYAHVQDVRVSAPAAALAALQSVSREAKGFRLPPVDKSYTLLFFKYYNCATGRITYAGSAMVPVVSSVAGCADILRQLLGDNNAKENISMFQEHSEGSVQPLWNEFSLIAARITPGSLLIGQKEHSPLVFRHPSIETFFRGLMSTVQVQLVHISFHAPTDLFKSNCTTHSTELLSSASSPSLNLSFLPSADMEGLSCVDVQIALPTVDKNTGLYNFKALDDTKNKIFYPSRRYTLHGIYRRLISAQWDYEEVCEAIGSISGYDANFIRLYHPDVAGIPRADPIRSSTRGKTDFFFGWRDPKPTLFFEVLEESRRVAQSRPRIIVTVRSERNEALYVEKLIANNPPTLQKLARGVLHRCAHAFAHVAADGSRTDKKHTHKTSAAAATAPFHRGAHCLALVLDAKGNVIKDIVEIPLDAAGADAGGALSPSALSAASVIARPADEPYVIDLVVAQPLESGQFRMACCQGECGAEVMSTGWPYFFGHPFVLTVSTSITIAEAYKQLVAYTHAKVNESDSLCQRVMMYAETLWRCSRGSEQVLECWKHVEKHNARIPTLILNHKRPKEKPGSRYVAQNNPTLSISKR